AWQNRADLAETAIAAVRQIIDTPKSAPGVSEFNRGFDRACDAISRTLDKVAGSGAKAHEDDVEALKHANQTLAERVKVLEGENATLERQRDAFMRHYDGAVRVMAAVREYVGFATKKAAVSEWGRGYKQCADSMQKLLDAPPQESANAAEKPAAAGPVAPLLHPKRHVDHHRL
ncbi:MAG: hypothetical protein JO107_16585, partial [Hyphomicrobiales bacterium]|nr:hypothetical protein [Hyphomicrobiales bacterium]MBV8664706.1 hypothetical protein [Hyphomicrobiales bacterium]